MFRRIFRSPYVKAGTAFLVSGLLLIFINSWLSRTHLSELIAKFNHTMMPVYIGIVLAFLLCPMYNRLVRSFYTALHKRGGLPEQRFGVSLNGAAPVVRKTYDKNPYERSLSLSKGIATLICMVFLFGIVALLGYFVLPAVISSIVNLVNTMPERLTDFAAWSSIHLRRFPEAVNMINSVANAGTTEVIAWVQEHILKNDYTTLAETISTSVLQFIRVFGNVFIGILISVYLLNYKEQLFAITRKIIAATCSEKRARGLSEFAGIINETFISFINGRLLDGAVIGVLTYIIMNAMNMPLPELISVIVGVTNVIPFFGPFIGAIPSALLLLIIEPMQALYFLIMILIIQQIDGNIIGPRIVGHKIGISSFWVLLAVLIGGGLFGFLGMALGVPIFAVFYRYMDKFTSSRLSKKEKKVATSDYLDYSKYNVNKEDIQGSRSPERPARKS
ncbi:MAG: AI-2E family transporter [Mogibacterium sp.]|nr:AI-2E family transporter [Mogibacterium sp.]